MHANALRLAQNLCWEFFKNALFTGKTSTNIEQKLKIQVHVIKDTANMRSRVTRNGECLPRSVISIL